MALRLRAHTVGILLSCLAGGLICSPAWAAASSTNQIPDAIAAQSGDSRPVPLATTSAERATLPLGLASVSRGGAAAPRGTSLPAGGNFVYWFPWIENTCPPTCSELYSHIGASALAPANVYVDGNFNGTLDEGELTASLAPSTMPTILFEGQLPNTACLVSDVPIQAYVLWWASDWGLYEDQSHECAPAQLGTQFVVPLGDANGVVHIVATMDTTTVQTPDGAVALNTGDHHAVPALAGDVITSDKPIGVTLAVFDPERKDSSAAVSIPPIEQAGTGFWVPPRFELIGLTVIADNRRLIVAYQDGAVETREMPVNASLVTTDRPAHVYWVFDVETNDPWAAQTRRRQEIWLIPPVGELGTECIDAGYLLSTHDGNVIRIDGDYDGVYEQEVELQAGQMFPGSYQRTPPPDTALVTNSLGAVQATHPVFAWQVAVGNWNGSDEQVSGTEQPPIPNLRLSVVRAQPSVVGNSGPVTVAIIGAGFREGATVVACLAGDPDVCITPTDVTVVNQCDLRARFDFLGMPVGSVWDLRVTNPDAATADLLGALTLAQPQVNLWMDIVGSDRVRSGTEVTYQIRYGNTGNADAGETVIAVQLPNYVEYVTASPPGVYLHPESPAMELWFEDRVPAGTVAGNTLAVKVPAGLAPGTPFDVSAAIGPTTSEIRDGFCPETEEIVPGVTAPDLGSCCGEGPPAWTFVETRLTVTRHPLSPVVSSNSDGTCTVTLRCRTWTMHQERSCDMLCTPSVICFPSFELSQKECGSWTTVSADGDIEERTVTVDCDVACALNPESCQSGDDIHGQVVGAIDPNEKTGPWGYAAFGRNGDWTGICPPDSFLDLGYVPAGRPLQYVIRFENVPTATAVAENIVVTDALDPNLDWSTLQVGESVIAGESYYPAITLNEPEHTISWTFTGVNLPPNQTPPEGEGSVSFSVKPLADVPTGTEIRNYATIGFDTNPPMCTNEVIHTIDAAAPTSAFDALPASQRWPLIILSWQGADDPGGSGLDRYSLYVSEAGAPVDLLAAGLTQSLTVFTGGYDHTYDFYICGRDNTGNLEAISPTPGATIATGEGFSDIPEGFWAFRELYLVALADIAQGYADGSYGPSIPVTRDQMAVYISRALVSPSGDAAIPDPTPPPSFSDVPSTHWAYKHIEYAASQSVVEGYGDGTYQPGTEVTRDQMAVYVARSMVAPSGEAGLADYVPADPRNFSDVASDFWAYKHIEYCVENGVVQGYDDGLYHPEIVVTRDQMAAYIARAFQLPL